jgi:hypothetical protein
MCFESAFSKLGHQLQLLRFTFGLFELGEQLLYFTMLGLQLLQQRCVHFDLHVAVPSMLGLVGLVPSALSP